MKFHLTTGAGNVFTGYGPGFVRIGALEYRENVLVTPEQVVTGWAAAGFAGLTEADFDAVAQLKPEVALVGPGSAIRFPHPRLTRACADARIGAEVIVTPPAYHAV